MWYKINYYKLSAESLNYELVMVTYTWAIDDKHALEIARREDKKIYSDSWVMRKWCYLDGFVSAVAVEGDEL